MSRLCLRGSSAVADGDIRNEVLRLAARRDRKLGEELLTELRRDRQQEREADFRSTRDRNCGIRLRP